ncbi:sperm flagellar protein 1 [Halyomorpha halys]|uniref:sperm flagellar protein 1 n=1 Tax=Halyomorpha halys TaxID=286706 RepID=UPI0006D4E630|nr:sperm flagellar protein 1 [Halyomorpha halys]
MSDVNKDSKLKEEELDDLYNWLEGMKLSKPKKNLARDFSDGLLMAELLKQYFPRHVDLHNYIPANSFANKLKNWNWLNDKVLKPLGIGQDPKVLKSIASCDQNKLEKVLISVKDKVDDQDRTKSTGDSGSFQCNFRDDDEIPEAEMKTIVSVEEFNILNDKLRDKIEEVSILSSKVKHFEAMIQLKDQRIEDLVAQIQKCTCQKS